MFNKLQADEQQKIKNLPVFAKDAQFYNDLTKLFLDELDKDIRRTEEEINALLRVKDAKLKNLLDIFDCNHHGFH